MARKLRKDVRNLTTGQVAEICEVVPRTVTQWFDSGKLKGYRIPGSKDRRIPRKTLVAFLRKHGMPLGELQDTEDEKRVLLISPTLLMLSAEFADVQILQAGSSLFAAGRMYREYSPDYVVLDTALGVGILTSVIDLLAEDATSIPVLFSNLPDEPNPSRLSYCVLRTFTGHAAREELVGFLRDPATWTGGDRTCRK